MRHARRRLGWVLAAALLALAGCATVPTEYREPRALGETARAELNLRVFDRAWTLVNEHYFDAALRGVDWRGLRDGYRREAAAAADDEALYAVINRMGDELKESHLGALTPRQAHELRVEHRPALGFRWRLLDGRPVVMEVTPGGSAAENGVRPGWILTTWAGEPVDPGRRYRSRLGQPVTLGFLDGQDQERTLTLEPRLLNFDRLETRMLADGFVYLRFDEFNGGSLRWLSAQLKAHREAPGVVVDLRQNSGGSVFTFMIAVAEFFERPPAAGRFVRRSGRDSDLKGFAWRSARYGGAVAVLTDAATASAAEIFSHVLQYHGRATLVGRRTGGLVIMARFYPLPDGGRLQVPVQDYVGLRGERLEERGVSPDIETPARTRDDLRAGQDGDVEAAVAALRRRRPGE